MQHASSVIYSSYQCSANFGTAADLQLGRVNGDSTNRHSNSFSLITTL